MPLLTVLDLTQALPVQPPPEIRSFTEKDGRTVECVRQGEDWYLRRVISTRLPDYLDPRLQPGARYTPEKAAF